MINSKIIRTVILFVIILFIILFGSYSFYTHYSYKDDNQKQIENDEVRFIPLEEIIVNLDTEPGKSSNFLRVKITLEVNGKDNADIINKFMPRIKDSFISYMRQLHVTDLQGTIGAYKLKMELLVRGNKIIEPNKINNIIITDILVQ